MEGKEEKKAVLLPTDLYKKIEERVNTTEFNSVEEYAVFVLEEVLRCKEDKEKTFSEEEEKKLKKRLEALGYLD